MVINHPTIIRHGMCLKNTENTWMAFITHAHKHVKRVSHVCHVKAIQEYINVLLDRYVISGLHGAGVCGGSTLHRSNEQKPPIISIKKDPPTYPAGGEMEHMLRLHKFQKLPQHYRSKSNFLLFPFPGSEEERWQIQIVAKGRVSCPKCKSVSRKTVEGLKKHMENCRQVSCEQPNTTENQRLSH